MKVIKSIFFFIIFLIMAGCTGILVCAFNPSLTAMLAEKVDGTAPVQSGGLQGMSGGDDGQQDTTGGLGDIWRQIISDLLRDKDEGQDVRPGVNTGWMDGDGVSYEIPGDQPGEIPDSVSGRNGYESVKEEAEQIAEEEADDLSKSIATGETGSGLSFQELYYPYYAMLEEDMRRLYHQIYANALKLTASYAPITPVSFGQVKTVFEAVYNDHPELFWLESGYSCKYLSSGRCVEIIMKYNSAAEDLDESKRRFEASAERILSGAQDLGDYEKEKYVHDALMQTVEYDTRAAMNQSAYSALVEGRTVCAGYARSFQYLMQQLGIPCYYCTGYAGEDHAWNIVNFDDDFYNVDVTWDDTDNPTYDYFNKTDREFAATHRRTGLSVYLPACVSDSGDEDPEGGVVIADGIGSGDNDSEEGIGIAEGSGDGDAEGEADAADIGEDIDMDGEGDMDEEDAAAEAEKQAKLAQAGITEEEVRDTMEEYYEDCLKLLKEAGTGDKQFSNVIPESLWGTVEQAYSGGAYWDEYVDEALESLGVENFLIQLQVQRLGGGYYRLYHNVYTY